MEPKKNRLDGREETFGTGSEGNKLSVLFLVLLRAIKCYEIGIAPLL